MFIEKGAHIKQSGLREIHFSSMLSNERSFAQFVTYFEAIPLFPVYLLQFSKT